MIIKRIISEGAGGFQRSFGSREAGGNRKRARPRREHTRCGERLVSIRPAHADQSIRSRSIDLIEDDACKADAIEIAAYGEHVRSLCIHFLKSVFIFRALAICVGANVAQK
jgi:hypothetical protein